MRQDTRKRFLGLPWQYWTPSAVLLVLAVAAVFLPAGDGWDTVRGFLTGMFAALVVGTVIGAVGIRRRAKIRAQIARLDNLEPLQSSQPLRSSEQRRPGPADDDRPTDAR